VLNASDTVEFIIKNKCSVSRYGDGELGIIYDLQDHKESHKSGFQTFNTDMAKRLEEILKEGGDVENNHYVALPACMFGFGVEHVYSAPAHYWWGFIANNVRRTAAMLKKDAVYLDTNFSRFYLSHKDKSGCRSYIERVKQIWADRDVVIVEGEKTRLGMGNDLFESARSVKRILCPATNAWDKYNEIISRTTEITPPILTLMY
jgi:glycosyltransferase family protein